MRFGLQHHPLQSVRLLYGSAATCVPFACNRVIWVDMTGWANNSLPLFRRRINSWESHAYSSLGLDFFDDDKVVLSKNVIDDLRLQINCDWVM